MKKIFTVVEHNRLDCIEKCLKSIKDTAKNPDEIDVYYYDSGSNDECDEIGCNLMQGKTLDDYYYNKDNVGPAHGRNHYWIQILKQEKDPYLLIKYDGNNEMIMKDWDVKIDEYFNKNPMVGAVCFGEPGLITMDNVINRSYNFIIVRSGYAKILGGFRDFKYITGLPWGLDDIDYAIKLQCESKFMSLDWNISRKVPRPPELSVTGKELYQSMCEADPKGERFIELTRLYQDMYSKGNYDWR